MRRQLGMLVVTSFMVAAGCAGPSTVETAVRDAFVECMDKEGIAVEDVDVAVRDGRHIETFSWEPVREEGVDEISQKCEDAALRKFQVSRS